MKRIDKNYVSDIDLKLAEFEQTHPKSTSEKAEIDKYARITELLLNPALSIRQEPPSEDPFS